MYSFSTHGKRLSKSTTCFQLRKFILRSKHLTVHGDVAKLSTFSAFIKQKRQRSLANIRQYTCVQILCITCMYKKICKFTSISLEPNTILVVSLQKPKFFNLGAERIDTCRSWYVYSSKWSKVSRRGALSMMS